MHVIVILADWRKRSLWCELHCCLVVTIVADHRYYPLFREHSRSPCYLDEHYAPMLVTNLFPALNANRSVTWADWSCNGSHPATYNRGDVLVRLLQRMRSRSKCAYNDNAITSTCFLFARKFEAAALASLLRWLPSSCTTPHSTSTEHYR
ncbi:hypothetical protein Cni_G08832 [Canna indica]|uniref:Uncharacterized protein n=1 Tax=Canna indica TaxID=4628 RepID=A0AAQ3Q760_9LILI|nr:hypothetical protein Cni_G08832 [Canna indica]